MKTISYAIPVHNEHVELKRLLTQIVDFIGLDDEIVVQGDQGKVTDEVVAVLRKFRSYITYVEYPLNKDFATFKNNLFKNCSKDYIFQIDADEELSEFYKNTTTLVLENPNIDAFIIPRKNIVNGITDDYIKKMGWVITNIDGEDVINWPDWQVRLFKNHIGIHLENKVHERLVGMSSTAFLPEQLDYAILHYKSIDRQITQNNFYDNIH